jgi:hypothetical protein
MNNGMHSYKDNYLWENNHQNIQFRAKRYYDPSIGNILNPNDFVTQWIVGAKSLKDIISEGIDNNRCVRGVGSGWSLSEVMKTTDYLVNSGPLDLIKTNFEVEDTVAANDANNIVLVQSGVKVSQLNMALQSLNKALETTGASDGQTIGGAISTGTHGSAIDIGSMADLVLALHIITSPDEEYWIEPSNKVFSDAFVTKLLPDTKRINDDDVFNSAVVSFGSFGLIYGVALRCVPNYLLSVYHRRYEWDLIKNCLNNPRDLSVLNLPNNPYHFEVIKNPFDPTNGVVVAMYKEAANTPPTLIVEHGRRYRGITDLIAILAKITDEFPFEIPVIMRILNHVLLNNYPPYEGETQYPYNLFTSSFGTSLAGPGVSCELGLDIADAVRVSELIIDIIKNKVPIIGLLCLRFVKKSRATLAFTKFETTCTVELPAIHASETASCYNKIWKTLEEQNIPFTLHWGQVNNLNERNLTQKYGPNLITKWKEARSRILLEPRQRKMFTNHFVNQCGLNAD